jgi:hypothetical protein
MPRTPFVLSPSYTRDVATSRTGAGWQRCRRGRGWRQWYLPRTPFVSACEYMSRYAGLALHSKSKRTIFRKLYVVQDSSLSCPTENQ